MTLDPVLRDLFLRASEQGLASDRHVVPPVSPRAIWLAYTSEELLPGQFDTGLEEIGRRCGPPGLDAQLRGLQQYVEQNEIMGLAYDASAANSQIARAAAAIGAYTALHLLPDQRVPDRSRRRLRVS
ncbi:MAG: hypothetical protein M3071_11385 [Actinomycetota bacterium]|nr:hypothetical protein [Actinomycetota bacterium]